MRFDQDTYPCEEPVSNIQMSETLSLLCNIGFRICSRFIQKLSLCKKLFPITAYYKIEN